MISKQDRIKPRTVEDLERRYNFERQFSQPHTAKGEDGLTPYIGANGNWWIGVNDTGVKASGSTVSFTPAVTEGTPIGTLTIDGVDTLVYAPNPQGGEGYVTREEWNGHYGYDAEAGVAFIKVGGVTLTESDLLRLLDLLQ